MARARVEVIEALRNTAATLSKRDDYQWGHMGSCNCGFLAQEITRLDKKEIHRRAMQKYGDWNEQLNDYCPDSGMPMDDLISELTAFGFGLDDLKKLETLSDTDILRKLPAEDRYLNKNKKADVVKYLIAWAEHLEDKLIERVPLEKLIAEPEHAHTVTA